MTKKDGNTINNNEETEKLFDFEENIEDGEEHSDFPIPTQTQITEPQHIIIQTPNSTQTNTKYRIVLVKPYTYIIDVNGNGQQIQKSKYTTTYIEGDLIELPPEEGE